MNSNLLDQLNNILRQNFIVEGIDFCTDSCLILQYLNFLERRIPEKTRNCLQTSIFKEELQKLPTDLQKGFSKLKKAIENGENLNKYQSTKIDISSYTDKLYLHEQLIHFHLKPEMYPKNPKFIDRSNNMAIVFINSEKVIFIKIKVHGGDTWTSNEYIKILDKEFPQDIRNKKLIGIKPDNYTKDEINNLRNKGAIYIIGNENEDGYCNTLDPVKALTLKEKEKEKENRLDQAKLSHLEIKKQLLKDLEQLNINLEKDSQVEIKTKIKKLLSDLGSLAPLDYTSS